MQQPPGGQPPGGQPPGQQGGFQQGGFQQGAQPQGGQPQGGQPLGGPQQPGFAGGAAGQSQPGYGAPSPFTGGGGGGSDSKADRAKGFAKSLFDFSFESFVSPRVLKIMYGFWLFMVVPMFLFLLMTWYQALTWESYDFNTGTTESDPRFGLFCGSTIMFPIFVFVWVLMGRVLFERGILAFRHYAVLQDVLDELKKKNG